MLGLSGKVSLMDLRLRPFSLADEPAARIAHEELARDNFTFLLRWNPAQPWETYIEALDKHRHGLELPSGWVPSSDLAADVNGELVGRVSIRHELNEFLRDYGGHIGYGVRPAYRGRGFGTEILRQALIVARAQGVEAILLTCDDDNVVSAKIIERLGGVHHDTRTSPDGQPIRRYWIR
jgi:predicted acetyltransferase